MREIKLFTDSSVNPQKKIGYASYLYITDEDLSLDDLNQQIKTKKFENTSSTKLELQSLLWALKYIPNDTVSITVYTDCQNIIGLKDRRKGFEKNNYYTGKGTLINNHELYKEFYILTDKLDCKFIKVKGHKKSSLKDSIDTIFTLVDKSSRNKLREFIHQQERPL